MRRTGPAKASPVRRRLWASEGARGRVTILATVATIDHSVASRGTATEGDTAAD